MIRVWKCNFCCEINVDKSKISAHEKKCSWNEKFKKCHTCEHREEQGYEYSIMGCALNMDILKGEEEGNCPKWLSMKDKLKERNKKLTSILKFLKVIK